MDAPPAAVVFDMDGLLLDTERLAREAFDEACTALGLTVDSAVYARCIGSNRAATAVILTEALGSEADYQSLDRHWEERYLGRIYRAPVALKPGALALLQTLQAHGVPRALATSTGRPTATLKLERAGLISFFSCLVCGGETERGKPHPDPYLAALTALGTAPSRTWALEDSDNGVRSAHAAGLRVFQIPDLLEPHSDVLALGHRVVRDLHEVHDELCRLLATS